jgi:glycosyltransferase involved in cell wall biosynthesis
LTDNMQEKNNVLVLVEKFGQGGSEKVAAMLAEMLQETGRFRVHFCSIYKPEKVFYKAEGVNICSLDIEIPSGKFGKVASYWQKFRKLSTLKKQLDTAVTISSLWPADWMNAITGRDAKIAVIQINILNNAQNVMMIRFKKLVQYIYNRCNRVVVSSANLVPELTGFFNVAPGKVQVIPNPVDTELIAKNTEAILPFNTSEIFGKYKVLITVSRLHPIKNISALAYILKQLQEDPLVKLLVIGEGEDEGRIKEALGENSLKFSHIDTGEFDETATVYFMGFQSNIHNLISHASIFLFPTKGEGSPLALLETLQCGTPVIVSDCPNGGVSEILSGPGKYDSEKERKESEWVNAGWLMPIPDPAKAETIQQWVVRTRELLNASDAEKRLMKAEAVRIASAYDKSKVKQHWLELIRSLIKK